MKDNLQGGKKHMVDKSYLVVQVSDNSNEDVSPYISEVNDFIHSARVGNLGVLIHCLSGISRSAFFTVAYLMSSCNLSLQISLNILRNQRHIAQPNEGFLRQLEVFESSQVFSETVRLRQKFGSERFLADREVTDRRLVEFNMAVERGSLCPGHCQSRADCPTHTCSPRSTRRRSFKIYNSRNSLFKRRKSSSVSHREDAEIIRGEPKIQIHEIRKHFKERRQAVKSWPPSPARSDTTRAKMSESRWRQSEVSIRPEHNDRRDSTSTSTSDSSFMSRLKNIFIKRI